MTNEFMGFHLTTNEQEALLDCLIKIRKEKRQEELRQKCKDTISFQINEAIKTIGLDETKRIVRELNRELRENTTN